MLETSRDVLNLVLALAVAALAFFTSWAIYYLVMILRQGFKAAREIKSTVNRIDKTVKIFRDKIEHSASYLLLIGEGLKKLVEVIAEKNDKDKKSEKENS